MKLFLFLILGLTLVWELSFTDGSLASLYKTSLGSAMWGAALLHLYDFMMSLRGKNSAYMIEFHSRLKKDIFTCLAFGLTLLIIFYAASTVYTFSNVDLACLGLPFLILSFFDLLAIKNLKVAGLYFPRKAFFVLLTLPIGAYVVFSYWLIDILSSRFSQSQALWMQITIFFTGIYALFAASFIRFVLEKQRMEFSPVLLEFFNSIKSSPRLYADAARLSDLWNAEVEKRNKEIRAIKQTARKKKQRTKKI